MADVSAAPPTGLPATILPALLDLLPSGVVYYRPVTDATGDVVDFAFAYLNPAAQQLLDLPAQPATTYLGQWPGSVEAGIFAFHRDAFLAVAPAAREQVYQADGYDVFFQIDACQVEGGLLVSFTPAATQARTAVEDALRQSQAREQARARELEAVTRELAQERENFYQLLEQAPAAISILRGPELRYAYVNPFHQRLLPGVPLLGRTVLEVRPDGAAQGLVDLLNRIYRTGEPFVAYDRPYDLDPFDGSPPQRRYFNFTYLPLREDGQVVGIGLFSFDVTEQVLARQEREARQQQVQDLNQDLAALNVELSASNQEYQRANTALGEAQQQLAQHQVLLQQILEQLPAGVATLEGAEYRFSFANERYQQLAGQRVVLGGTVAELFPEIVEQGLLTLLDQVQHTGQPFRAFESPARLDDAATGQSTQFYLDIIYQPLLDAQQQVTSILAFLLDVTEKVESRQQIQQLNTQLEARVQERTTQLAEQQSLLRQLLSQLPAAVAMLSGPEHRFAFANGGYQELVAGRAAMGKSVAEALPEVVDQGIIKLLDQVYASGQPFIGRELALMLTSGEELPATRYFDFTYQPFTDGQGQVQGILVFAVEVSEQVRVRRQTATLQAAMLAVAQRRAQERQDLYQIFEQTPAAIVLLREPDHRIDYHNPAFQSLFPPEQGSGPLQGHTLSEIYPSMQAAGLVHLLDQVFSSGKPQVVLEMPLADLQPGSERYVTFAYQAYREAGQIVGVAAFVYDATEQVLARQQVQEANQKLAAINEEMQATNEALLDTNMRLTRTNADLDTFVYSASHDLKSPITNIEGLLLALRKQLPPDALQTELVPKLLSMMDGAVQRFQQTLGHLTDVTRLQQVMFDQPAVAVDLPALVESVRLDILPELTAAGATLTLDLGACPSVYFPAKTLRSILYNLLSNAVKYRDPQRPAQVQLRCQVGPASQVILEVQDNGLGLDEGQQAELFSLFRRLHTHVSGSGVGLYMVKKMVDNAGGTLTVQSQPGVGSTFTVTLPAPKSSTT